MKVVALGALLVVWGNLLHRLIGDPAALPGGSWQFVLAGAALIAVSLVAAAWLRLDASSLGLSRAGAVRGFLVGGLAGGFIATAAVAATRLVPLVLGAPLLYGPLLGVSGDRLAWHVAVFLPLGAALPEELAFRGILLGAIMRQTGARAAILSSALTFALWHVSVVIATVADSTMGQTVGWWIFGIGAAMVILVIGGAIMAALRVVTGTLATSVAAHWAFNAVILIGLWTAGS